MPPPQRALIAGLGLIGGSIGLALRQRGWYVRFVDSDADLQPGDRRGRERGLDRRGSVDIVILATPSTSRSTCAAIRPLLWSRPFAASWRRFAQSADAAS